MFSQKFLESSGSQPFLAHGTLWIKTNLAARLYLEIFEKYLKKEPYLQIAL